MNQWTTCLLLLFAAFGLACSGNIAKGQEVRPTNFIIILVDDLGYQDVGFNGCQDIPTPNIDRIASEGVRFTNGYVSYPVCGPSRAGLITGRYQDRFGFGRNPLFAPNDPEMGLPASETTLAEALRTANYQSIALGKWHLGAHESLRPLQQGFDDFFGFLSGGHSYLPENWTRKDEYDVYAQYDAYRTKLLRNDVRAEETEYLTDALSREAVQYIEAYQAQPFFMYLAYNAPHGPLEATDKYLDRFPQIEEPKRKTYAAMVSAVDDGVGRVLEKLDELNLDQNTLIFFLSDNGGPEKVNASDNGHLRGGKGQLFEGGIRVPFAMRWPAKITEGLVFEAPVISLDIFATVVAQAPEATVPEQIDGVDLLPFLTEQKAEAPHDHLYWRKFDSQEYAVRNAVGEKVISSEGEKTSFRLATNGEEDSGKAEPDHSDVLKLHNTYLAWQKEMLDPVFLGLANNKVYSKKHPDRFTKPKQD